MHSWVIDGLGRVQSEAKPGSGSAVYTYDRAGNLTASQSPRSLKDSLVYDANDRLVRRVLPQVTYASQHCSTLSTQLSTCSFSFPTRLSSVCIAADTLRYRYDAAGRMTNADNRWARVRRVYSAGGLLVSDTLRTRTWYTNLNDNCEESAPAGLGGAYPQRFDQHVYGLDFTYDAAGRRLTLSHPNALDACASSRCVQRYAYNVTTGTLDSLIDRGSIVHTFGYDAAGRLTQKTSPGSVLESMAYDADDRLIRRHVGSMIADTLSLDAMGRVIRARQATTLNATVDLAYNGLGAVVATTGLSGSGSLEDYRVDGLGNRRFLARPASRVSGHADGNRMRLHSYDNHGRLTTTVDSLTIPSLSAQYDFQRVQEFDLSGNVQWRGERELDALASENKYDHLMSYYGSDERLAVANRHLGVSGVSDDTRPGSRGVWEMYRYDALGRRVQTMSVRGSACPSTATECASYLERTVWDGDQLLYEIRAPLTTPTADNAASGTYGAYGRVAYLHGGGIDAPLGVTRFDQAGQPAVQTLTPHATWQGDYQDGTTLSGGAVATCTGASGCPQLEWRAGKETADGVVTAPVTLAWWGRLLTAQADGSGLTYQRHRFYDPLTGQFTQPDPIGLAGGKNLYAFAGGDPVNFRDPFGLCVPWPACALAAGRAGAAAGTLVGAGLGAFGAGAGAIPGAVLGNRVGWVVGAGTATVGAIYLAGKHRQATDRVGTDLGIAGEHMDRVAGMPPDDDDPQFVRDMVRHAQKHLNNAKKHVENATGKTREELQRQIREMQKRVDEVRRSLPQ